MKKILILGNSTDRVDSASEHKKILNWTDDIWVCNLAFKETIYYKNISLVGTVHQWAAIEALNYKVLKNLNYEIISNFKMNQINEFINYKGFSTGIELIYEAISRGIDEIYLSGFCFINGNEKDIYTRDPNFYTGNFKKQWDTLKSEYPNCVIRFL